MKLRDAKKLHNGDQVTIEDTGETVEIMDAYQHPDNPHFVLVDAMTSEGFKTLTHLEIQ